MIRRTMQSSLSQIRDKTFNATLVNALTFGNGVQMVKHFEQHGAGLVDGTNDGSSSRCYFF